MPKLIRGRLHRRTAICRGAIFKGFLESVDSGVKDKKGPRKVEQVKIVSTIARVSLGVDFHEEFEEHRHKKRDRFWDDSEGKYFARDQMSWYLRKVCLIPIFVTLTWSLPIRTSTSRI